LIRIVSRSVLCSVDPATAKSHALAAMILAVSVLAPEIAFAQDRAASGPRPRLASLVLSPASAPVGATVEGRVTLVQPAGARVDVALRSADPVAVTVPRSVSLEAGAKSAAFLATVRSVPRARDVAITATLERTSRRAVLTVEPPVQQPTGPRTIEAGRLSVVFADSPEVEAPPPFEPRTIEAGHLSVTFADSPEPEPSTPFEPRTISAGRLSVTFADPPE
jgi:hypothetical protein